MPYSMISMLFLKQLLMLVLVRDDDFDDDTFVLLVVSNRKFQQFQSNNARAQRVYPTPTHFSLSVGDRFEIGSFSRSSTSSTFLHFA